MRAVVQRVKQASVTVDEKIIGRIDEGLLVFLGIGSKDTAHTAKILADKIVNLRIFVDGDGKFNLSALETKAAFLVVSQFTLYADIRKGRRPSFTEAARPEIAAPLIDQFNIYIRAYDLVVETGQFQAHMLVSLQNDGPVTIILDTVDLEPTVQI